MLFTRNCMDHEISLFIFRNTRHLIMVTKLFLFILFETIFIYDIITIIE